MPKINASKLDQIIQGPPITQSILGSFELQSLFIVFLPSRNVQNGIQSIMCILQLGRSKLPMTPRSCLGIALTSMIIVQYIHPMGCVDIVTISPKPCRSVEFLSVENPRSVWIHWNLELGVAFTEAQPRSPDGIGQLRLGQIASALSCVCSNLRREYNHAQMWHFMHTIQIFPELNNISHIGTQHSILILGHIPHIHHFLIPFRLEIHVRIGTHAEILGTYFVLLVGLHNILPQQSPGVGRPGSILGVNRMDVHLIHVGTVISRGPALGCIPPASLSTKFRHHGAIFFETSHILAGKVLL
mmetsp:Transcript_39085/g.68661  ORF Transcript_39085/g.68661 Transcript_39085/m.68661 type:complete len:300 (+) Transcript_39085:739-1638(+)